MTKSNTSFAGYAIRVAKSKGGTASRQRDGTGLRGQKTVFHGVRFTRAEAGAGQPGIGGLQIVSPLWEIRREESEERCVVRRCTARKAANRGGVGAGLPRHAANKLLKPRLNTYFV